MEILQREKRKISYLTLLDFKSTKNYTVENLFKITGLTKLRFYLASYERENFEITEQQTAPSILTSQMETFYTYFSENIDVEPSSSAVDFEPEESILLHVLEPIMSLRT